MADSKPNQYEIEIIQASAADYAHLQSEQLGWREERGDKTFFVFESEEDMQEYIVYLNGTSDADWKYSGE